MPNVLEVIELTDFNNYKIIDFKKCTKNYVAKKN